MPVVRPTNINDQPTRAQTLTLEDLDRQNRSQFETVFNDTLRAWDIMHHTNPHRPTEILTHEIAQGVLDPFHNGYYDRDDYDYLVTNAYFGDPGFPHDPQQPSSLRVSVTTYKNFTDWLITKGILNPEGVIDRRGEPVVRIEQIDREQERATPLIDESPLTKETILPVVVAYKDLPKNQNADLQHDFEKLLSENKDVIPENIEASMQGWQVANADYLQNPSTAIKALMIYEYPNGQDIAETRFNDYVKNHRLNHDDPGYANALEIAFKISCYWNMGYRDAYASVIQGEEDDW